MRHELITMSTRSLCCRFTKLAVVIYCQLSALLLGDVLVERYYCVVDFYEPRFTVFTNSRPADL